MFRQVLLGLKPNRLINIQQLYCSSATSISSEAGKWDILVGIQLERLPIITKTPTKLEQEYQVI